MTKAAILDSIRKVTVPQVPLPRLDELCTDFTEPATQFAAALKAVAGESRRVSDAGGLAAAIGERYPEARKVYSCVAAVANRGFAAPADGNPHAFDILDLAVVPAAFGVAENGAVWVESFSVPHRAALFLAQHLAVVLPQAQLVSTMHAAYARLAQAPMPDFGVFIAGPSKTADIEQCLVIGAHGPRSLTVFLVA